jgi:hypothetical protein
MLITVSNLCAGALLVAELLDVSPWCAGRGRHATFTDALRTIASSRPAYAGVTERRLNNSPFFAHERTAACSAAVHYPGRRIAPNDGRKVSDGRFSLFLIPGGSANMKPTTDLVEEAKLGCPEIPARTTRTEIVKRLGRGSGNGSHHRPSQGGEQRRRRPAHRGQPRPDPCAGRGGGRGWSDPGPKFPAPGTRGYRLQRPGQVGGAGGGPVTAPAARAGRARRHRSVGHRRRPAAPRAHRLAVGRLARPRQGPPVGRGAGHREDLRRPGARGHPDQGRTGAPPPRARC